MRFVTSLGAAMLIFDGSRAEQVVVSIVALQMFAASPRFAVPPGADTTTC